MNSKSSLFVKPLILLTLLLSACGKYEEGPSLSFRSKIKRITGDWEVTDVLISGEDASSYTESDAAACENGSYFNYTSEYSQKYKITISSDNKHLTTLIYDAIFLDYLQSYQSCLPIYQKENISEQIEGTWNFSDLKEGIVITNFLQEGGKTEIYEILQLKNDQMKWKGLTDEDEVILISFKKIN